jgi:hypothetical protein
MAADLNLVLPELKTKVEQLLLRCAERGLPILPRVEPGEGRLRFKCHCVGIE